MKLVNDAGELEKIARELRIDILKMLATSGSGHTGGSLSAIDILTALYFGRMNHNPNYGKSDDRDIFVLSKGHGAPALYAVLARCGYFDKSHLGQGLSMANGVAMAFRLDGRKGTVFCMMGDGETQEGQIWEAAMTSAHQKLDNVVGILDNNGLQIDGWVRDIKGIEPIGDKWRAFGWEVIEIDGHDMSSILPAIDKAVAVKGKPSLIWAHTVKGKGVSFMENKASFHGLAPTKDELEKALLELSTT